MALSGQKLPTRSVEKFLRLEIRLALLFDLYMVTLISSVERQREIREPSYETDAFQFCVHHLHLS